MWETNVGTSDFFSPAAHGTAWFCCFSAILPLWLKIKIIQGFFVAVVFVCSVCFLLFVFLIDYREYQMQAVVEQHPPVTLCIPVYGLFFALSPVTSRSHFFFFFFKGFTFKPKGIFSIFISSCIFRQIKQLSVSVKSYIINTDKGVFPIL